MNQTDKTVEFKKFVHENPKPQEQIHSKSWFWGETSKTKYTSSVDPKSPLEDFMGYSHYSCFITTSLLLYGFFFGILLTKLFEYRSKKKLSIVLIILIGVVYTHLFSFFATNFWLWFFFDLEICNLINLVFRDSTLITMLDIIYFIIFHLVQLFLVWFLSRS
jgi:hypothetical protein